MKIKFLRLFLLFLILAVVPICEANAADQKPPVTPVRQGTKVDLKSPIKVPSPMPKGADRETEAQLTEEVRLVAAQQKIDLSKLVIPAPGLWGPKKTERTIIYYSSKIREVNLLRKALGIALIAQVDNDGGDKCSKVTKIDKSNYTFTPYYFKSDESAPVTPRGKPATEVKEQAAATPDQSNGTGRTASGSADRTKEPVVEVKALVQKAIPKVDGKQAQQFRETVDTAVKELSAALGAQKQPTVGAALLAAAVKQGVGSSSADSLDAIEITFGGREQNYFKAFIARMAKYGYWDFQTLYTNLGEVFDKVFDAAGKNKALSHLSTLYKANTGGTIIGGLNTFVLPVPVEDKTAGASPARAKSAKGSPVKVDKGKPDSKETWALVHSLTAWMAASPVDQDPLDHRQVAKSLRLCIRDGRAFAQTGLLQKAKINLFEILAEAAIIQKPTEANAKERYVRHIAMCLAPFGMGLFGQLDERDAVRVESDWRANTGAALLASKARWDVAMDSLGAFADAKGTTDQLKTALPLMVKNVRWLLQGVDMGDD